MSARQLKRMEKMSLGAAQPKGAQEDTSSSDDELPPTILVHTSKRKQQQRKSVQPAAEVAHPRHDTESAIPVGGGAASASGSEVAGSQASARPQVASAPLSRGGPSYGRGARDKKPGHVDPTPLASRADEGGEEASDWVEGSGGGGGHSSKTSKSQKKKEQKSAKKAKEAEEEELLRQLAGDGSGKEDDPPEAVGGALPRRQGPEAAAAAAGAGTSRTVEELMCCSATRLDTRQERIKAFGIAAVEDVGDRAGGNRLSAGAQHHRRAGAKAAVFRPCPFVTPNRFEWPPFHGLGVSLVRASAELVKALREGGSHAAVAAGSEGEGSSAAAAAAAAATAPQQQEHADTKKSSDKRKGQHGETTVAAGGASETVYMLDTSHPDHRAAQAAFERVVASLGGPQEMFALLQKHPYHIPTLLQCNTLFALMGDVPQSQTMLDMALYALGLAFGRFPFEAPASRRCLPHRIRSNQIVFVTLQRAVHSAMKRGCAKTALNLCKLLLSLDDTDPKCALLLLDYVALRASEWSWLVALHDALTAENSPLLALPSLHFHAALAKFLLESEDAAKEAKFKATSGGDGSASDGKAPIRSAQERMRNAIRVFPSAALQLAEKVGERPGEHPWVDMIPLLMNHTAAEAGLDAGLDHVTKLFVDHASDLWKPKDVLAFFRGAAAAVVKDGPAERHLYAARRQGWLRTGVLEGYLRARKEDLSGEQHQRIAPELLAAADAGDVDDFEGGGFIDEAEFLVTETERDLLLRYEALFGRPPGAAGRTPRRALEHYHGLLAAHERRIGGERNPVATFFHTLMPWNDVRETTLRRLFEERGIEDPVRRRRDEQRQRDADVERRVLDEDLASSSSSDGE